MFCIKLWDDELSMFYKYSNNQYKSAILLAQFGGSHCDVWVSLI